MKPSAQRRDNRVLKTLERVFSKAGRGSRSEARRWIGEGRVRVNGAIVRNPDQWIDLARDRVTLDGKPITTTRGIYILLYKPKGYLTTYRDPENRPTVYDLVADAGGWLAPVGRLDLDTSGLLLMTNDTAFADHVTSPAHLVSKAYQVKTATLLSEEQLERLRRGIELSDGPTRPAEARRLRDSGKHTFIEIVLTEGRNRQVRRMIEAAGSRVLKLVRTAIGPLRIADLAIGKWRRLTEEEIAALGGRARPPGPATSNTSEARPAARSRSRARKRGRWSKS
ncbi:MAG: pseudouridine synthase [Bryobacteraceae bacterium]